MNRDRARVLIGVIALAALVMAPRAHAQDRSVTEGLRLNMHAGGAVLGGGGDGARSVRPGLSAGYGNHRLFSVFMTRDRVPMSDGALEFDLRHIDLGVRAYLRGPAACLVPFVLGSYTWRNADYGRIVFLGDTQSVKVHGGGLTVGAGAAYYLKPRLALEASIKRTGGALDRVDANGFTFRHEESIIRDASLRLNVGLSWWIPR